MAENKYANKTYPTPTERTKSFVPLHVHTHYSLLDGHTLIPDYIDRLKSEGMDMGGISDHGNLHGVYEFYKTATANGIKPIIGIEAYVAPSPISHKTHEPYFFSKDENQRKDDVSSKGAYTHMLIFAKNNDGLKALFKLSELSYTEGYYRKPRMSVELFKEYANGNLIGTSGCPSGEFQTKLRLGLKEEAIEYARMMQQIFGKENYFMEIMDHDMAIDLERKVIEDILEISQLLNIPLLATPDSHYTFPEDANVHEHMLCISTHSKMNIPTSLSEGEGGKTRFAFSGNGYYIPNAEEMFQKFPEHKFPGAVTNTRVVAEMCDITINPRDDLRPVIPLPEGETESSWVTKEAFKGLMKRLPGLAETDQYKDRLNYELEVITTKNYSGYFLVVSDFIRWAKNKGIPMGPGRGSAAGSLVAYCLDITDADPIRHGLLFERFLNPERESPPDIDIDVDDLRREDLIAYVKEKFGFDQVAQVVTFGKILAKNAVKDTVRILDLPYALGDRLSKAMPEPIFGKSMSLHDMFDPGSVRFDEAEDFRALVKQENVQEVVDVALGLEGRIRSTGVHAAAVIISSKPVGDAVPMMMRQEDGAMLTQWDYPTCENLGLIKYDFLGLRNLGIIDNALKHVKKLHGVDLSYVGLVSGEMNDPKVYELLASGNTLGVFQLDSSGIQSLLRLMKPTRFEDISAVLALFRPGPMGVGAHTDFALRKNGVQKVDFIHPELTNVLTSILSDTFGIIVYQEQIQLIAREMAGYSLGQADNLRRAMGKKKREVLDAEFGPFKEGARNNGYSDEAIQAIWDVMTPFADYAFNKCFSDSTLIRMGDGSIVSGRELYDRFTVGEELYVQSMWSDGEVRPHKVKNVVDTGVKPAFEVRTAGGRSIITSEDHRLLTTRGYVEVKDMIVGVDELVTADELLSTEAQGLSSVSHVKQHAGLLVYPGGLEEVQAAGLTCGSECLWSSGGEGYGGGSFASNGMWCVSQNERDMAEFLIENNIFFEMHKAVNRGQCGFYFEGLYWEMDDMDRHISYFERKYGDLPFVVVTPEDFRDRVSQVMKLDHVRNGDLVVAVEPVSRTSMIDIEMEDGGPKNFVTFMGVVSHNSHTVAYGMTSYVTAFLKANYPAEFYAALLSSVADDTDKTAAYLDDARMNGIKVLPPDVSRSDVDYVPLASGEVLFGLKAIRGIGSSVGNDIVEARENGGMFKDFNDFITRVPSNVVNKRVLEGLALGGALDGFGFSRRALSNQVPDLVARYQKVKRKKASSQVSLFEVDEAVEYVVYPMDEFPRMEKLSLERNALGLYVSGHPIDGLNIGNMATVKISDLVSEVRPAFEGWPPRNAVPYRIAGILTSLTIKRTKKGEQFVICKLEDRSGSIECAIFPNVYNDVKDLLKIDGVYQFVGFTRKRNESVSFNVDSARPLDFSESGNLSVRVKVTEKQWKAAEEEFMRRLGRHKPPLGEPGDDVILSVKASDGSIYENVLPVQVKRSPALIQEIQELLGALSIGRWRSPNSVNKSDTKTKVIVDDKTVSSRSGSHTLEGL